MRLAPLSLAGLSREALLRRRDESLTRAASPFGASLIQGLLELGPIFAALAAQSFLEDADIDGFLHGMSLSAGARLHLLAGVERGLRCPPALLRVTDGAALFAALASGHGRLPGELARSKLTSSPGAGDAKHEVAFAEALRGAVTGRLAEARESFARFERSRPKDSEDRALILGGILDSDEDRFAEGLSRFVAALPRRPGQARLSVEAIGFARLGQGYGLSVTVNDPAIPVELLGEAEAPYPDPREILPPFAEEILDASAPDASSLDASFLDPSEVASP